MLTVKFATWTCDAFILHLSPPPVEVWNWHFVFSYLVACADMSSTAFIEPLPVIEFVTRLLNREVSTRPLSDADRVKVR